MNEPKRALLLGGTGAVRVHGGGFAGTALAFVPDDRMEACFVWKSRER